MSTRSQELLSRLLSLEPSRAHHLESLEGGIDEREMLESWGLATPVVRKGLEARASVLMGDHNVGREDLDCLEAIILVSRPVVDVTDGTFVVPPGEFAGLNAMREVIEAAIAATGRVEAVDTPPFAGTAFLVGKRLVMTNRHVAKTFSEGVGLQIRPYAATSVDLRREVGSTSSGPTMNVTQVVMVHPYWDMALLEVDDDHGREPLRMADEPIARGTDVVVIGYPFYDHRSAAADLGRLFRQTFGVKRLLPGRVGTLIDYDSFGRRVAALKHDASTLGGSSGSPVFDPETGVVVALHFAGSYQQTNVGVPTWELLRDPRVRSTLGLEASNDSPAPDIERAWQAAFTEQRSSRPRVSVASGEDVSSSRDDIARARDWYERVDEDTLADLLRRDRQHTLALLEDAVGEEEAAEIDELFVPAMNEELFFSRPKVDPNLPEIVFIHGIMGGHLDSVGTVRERVWLSPMSFLFSDVANRLMLAADGVTDAAAGSYVQATGHFRFFYARAARRWRQAGFVVHEWSYDWRKSLAISAQRLDLFLQTIALDRPGRTFAIVAHSMGGLVASMAACRCPGFIERVSRAVFIGSPLGGSFAPLQAVLGTYDFLVKLAFYAPRVDLRGMQQLSRSLPGLLEMLPDPEIFAEAKTLYEAGAWPEELRPSQVWLDRSRHLKKELRQSPLLERSSLVVSLERPTVASLAPDRILAAGRAIHRGDGTVPAASALVPGVPAFAVEGDHSLLPRRDDAIDAVSSLLRLGSAKRRVPEDYDAWAQVAEESAARFDVLEGAALVESVRERGSRRLTARDLEWLFSSGVTAPPT
jgi:pimeloyl-ACP methyl ester carboxylesterase